MHRARSSLNPSGKSATFTVMGPKRIRQAALVEVWRGGRRRLIEAVAPSPLTGSSRGDTLSHCCNALSHCSTTFSLQTASAQPGVPCSNTAPISSSLHKDEAICNGPAILSVTAGMPSATAAPPSGYKQHLLTQVCLLNPKSLHCAHLVITACRRVDLNGPAIQFTWLGIGTRQYTVTALQRLQGMLEYLSSTLRLSNLLFWHVNAIAESRCCMLCQEALLQPVLTHNKFIDHVCP